MSDEHHTTPPHKTCTKCQRSFPATTSYFGKHTKNGLRPECKECLARWKKQYYQVHADRINEKKKQYVQAHAERTKEYRKQYYQANAERISERHKRYDQAHAEHIKERKRQYRQAHAEHIHKWQKQYKRSHPELRRASDTKRRARKNGAAISDFTAQQWQDMQAAYDHRCVYCHKRYKGKLTQDHITPISKGGNHTYSNIVPACRRCNSSKGTGQAKKLVQPLLLMEHVA
jgi:5-methylcytosine-specific restriction endonuclease McrA